MLVRDVNFLAQTAIFVEPELQRTFCRIDTGYKGLDDFPAIFVNVLYLATVTAIVTGQTNLEILDQDCWVRCSQKRTVKDTTWGDSDSDSDTTTAFQPLETW